MNLILFEARELTSPLPLNDPRALHLSQILRRESFEEFDSGIIDGSRGKARIVEKTSEGYRIQFTPTDIPPPLFPLILAAGAGRPQTAKKILREITAMGVSAIHFFASGKGDKAYLRSSIYKDDNYRPYLIEGAQQAFCTRLPRVRIHSSLGAALREFSDGKNFRSVCLDNYEAKYPLKDYPFNESKTPLVLWIGSERGWSEKERKIFSEHEIPLASLGKRILRTETASVSGISICLAGIGHLD